MTLVVTGRTILLGFGGLKENFFGRDKKIEKLSHFGIQTGRMKEGAKTALSAKLSLPKFRGEVP